MHRYILSALAFFFLFSNFTCEGECDFFEFDTIPLDVQLENPATTYRQGDVLWLNASFPASQPFQEGTFTIGEGGGLIVTQLFNFDGTSTELTAGLGNFTVQQDIGIPIENGTGDDPSASITRFVCPNGTCSYRTGFRLDSVGTYLLRVNGSAIDEVNEAFRYCNDPTFGTTTLVGGNNLAGETADSFLQYGNDQSTFGRFSSISPDQDQNLFLIRVE